jgi:hypothetical protein
MTTRDSITRRSHSTRFGLIFLFLGLLLPLSAQEKVDEPQPKTNLEVIQGVVSDLANELVEKCTLSSEQGVLVRFRNPDSSWVMTDAFLQSLKRKNHRVYLSSSTPEGKTQTLDVALFDAAVEYGRAFRESFLGKRKSERTVVARISANVRSENDEVLFAGGLTRTFRDTVYVRDISDLETPSLPITHGAEPRGGFIDEFFEPVIIIGASAVAVYLFFTVRS